MGLDAVWKVLQQFHAHYTRFRMLDMRESGLFGQFYEEHREIVSLIRKGEAEELTRLIARHLEGPLDRMEAEKEKAGPPGLKGACRIRESSREKCSIAGNDILQFNEK